MGSETMRKKKLVAMMALLPMMANAQVVPEIQPSLVEAVDVSGMSDTPITVTKQEREALNIAGKWIKHTSRPTPSGDGSVQYVFGTTMPTLICTPLHVCAVRFRPGEVISSIKTAESARWKLSTSSFGTNGVETEVITVSPRETGIVTNLVVTTNERIYTILLKAARNEWMPFINFHYPEDDEKANREYQAQRQRQVYSSTLSNGMNVANLDFGYQIGGDNTPWKPIRVYTDGRKTYLEFTSLSNEAPALFELESQGGVFSDPETKQVNYRAIGNKYVIDGIPKMIGLATGVGNSQKMVVIEKTGAK